MYSEKVRFKPWEGDNYKKTNPKLLILGESFYGKSNGGETVKEYIQSIVDGDWDYAFFTKLQNMFSNPEHWDEITKKNYELNRERFWHDVCFYEYIQHPMKEAKQAVPSHYWEEAKEPFMEVLKVLKPDIVLALGFETYHNLPQGGEEGKTIKWNNNYMETWKYNYNNKLTHVCKIQHPSSPGFSQDVWIGLMDKFLKTVYSS